MKREIEREREKERNNKQNNNKNPTQNNKNPNKPCKTALHVESATFWPRDRMAPNSDRTVTLVIDLL